MLRISQYPVIGCPPEHRQRQTSSPETWNGSWIDLAAHGPTQLNSCLSLSQEMWIRSLKFQKKPQHGYQPGPPGEASIPRVNNNNLGEIPAYGVCKDRLGRHAAQQSRSMTTSVYQRGRAGGPDIRWAGQAEKDENLVTAVTAPVAAYRCVTSRPPLDRPHLTGGHASMHALAHR